MLGVVEQGLEFLWLRERGFAAAGGEDLLMLPVAEDAEGGFHGRAGDLGNLLARERDRVAEFLLQREQHLGDAALDGIVNRAALPLHLAQPVAEQADGLLIEERVLAEEVVE